MFVPYVVSHLHEKQNIQINTYDDRNDSENQDYSFVDWEEITENVKKTVLTEIFESLYYRNNKYVGDTYKIFSNSNLKEI